MTDAPTRAGPPMTAIPLPEPPYFDPQALRVELTGLFQSHGSADAFSFGFAIGRAYDAAENRVVERIAGRMARTTVPDTATAGETA